MNRLLVSLAIMFACSTSFGQSFQYYWPWIKDNIDKGASTQHVNQIVGNATNGIRWITNGLTSKIYVDQQIGLIQLQLQPTSGLVGYQHVVSMTNALSASILAQFPVTNGLIGLTHAMTLTNGLTGIAEAQTLTNGLAGHAQVVSMISAIPPADTNAAIITATNRSSFLNRAAFNGLLTTNNIAFMWSDSSRTLVVSNSPSYVVGGQRYDAGLAITSPVVPDVSGSYYLWIDAANNWQVTTNVWSFDAVAQMMWVLWDDVDKHAIIETIEAHPNSISDDQHKKDHLAFGARKLYGGGLTFNAITTGNPATNGSNTCIGAVASMTVADENLFHTMEPVGTSTTSQVSLGSAAQLPVLRWFGSKWDISKRDVFPFSTSNNAPLRVTGSGQAFGVSNDAYFVSWLCATPSRSTNGNWFVVDGWTNYPTLAVASNVSAAELKAEYGGKLPFNEFVVAYKLTYYFHPGNPLPYGTNIMSSRLSMVQDFSDLSQVGVMQGGTVIAGGGEGVNTNTSYTFANSTTQSFYDAEIRNVLRLLDGSEVVGTFNGTGSGVSPVAYSTMFGMSNGEMVLVDPAATADPFWTTNAQGEVVLR